MDLDSLEEGARLWFHGLALTIVLLIVTTVFAFFGLALSFAVLGGALVFVAFIVLPLIYGWISAKLSDLLHTDVSSKDLDSLGDWVVVWIHGLVLVVVLLFIATFFGFFGLSLTTTILMNAFADVGAFVFALLSFTVLPIVYGFTSKGLTQLLD